MFASTPTLVVPANMTPVERMKGGRMKLISILACHRELKKRGHTISRRDLYHLKNSGELKMVNGKTSPEAVIYHLEQALGLSASITLHANQHQHTAGISDALPRSHGHKAGAPSNGRSRRDDTSKRSLSSGSGK